MDLVHLERKICAFHNRIWHNRTVGYLVVCGSHGKRVDTLDDTNPRMHPRDHSSPTQDATWLQSYRTFAQSLGFSGRPYGSKMRKSTFRLLQKAFAFADTLDSHSWWMTSPLVHSVGHTLSFQHTTSVQTHTDRMASNCWKRPSTERPLCTGENTLS